MANQVASPQDETDFILGSVPLFNPRHDEFACLMAKGQHTATKAYQDVYTDASDETAKANGTRLMSYALIKDRIKFLRGEASKACIMTIGELINFHASVLRAPVGDVDENSPLCQEQVITENDRGTRTTIKVSSKATSAQELAKLCGWYKAEKFEGALDITTPEDVAARVQATALALHGKAEVVQKVLNES